MEASIQTAQVQSTAAWPRIRSLDWLRGLVIALMVVDHAGNVFDSAHMHGDSAARWVPGSALPTGEFLTRWVTHLCAPVFVLLAGASLALSMEKRRGQPGQTRFIVTRGLFIAALDPLWMSLGFAGYSRFVFQVLYAIGLSLVCMAFLRRFSSALLVGLAGAIQVLGELSSAWQPVVQPWHALWGFLFLGGPVFEKTVCAYPLIPWLSIMMFGWVLGRWHLTQPRGTAKKLLGLGVALLGMFAVVRWVDGYGNWNLHRDSNEFLQWLHVAKYPPSLTYVCLELALGLMLLALFVALDESRRALTALQPLALFGSTAFFFYVLHVHAMAGFQWVVGIDRDSNGLLKTWVASGLTLALLAPLCWLYLRYKRANPDGWARYV